MFLTEHLMRLHYDPGITLSLLLLFVHVSLQYRTGPELFLTGPAGSPRSNEPREVDLRGVASE